MKIYDYTVQGFEVNPLEITDYLLSIVNGLVWQEIGLTKCDILHKREVFTHDNIRVWYDFGADYFFFEDIS